MEKRNLQKKNQGICTHYCSQKSVHAKQITRELRKLEDALVPD